MLRTTHLTHFLPNRLLAALLGLALALGALAAPSAVQAAGGDGLRAAANDYRTEGGLRAVSGSDLLDDIATRRAAQMVNLHGLNHDLEYVRDRLRSAGVCYTALGEIVAWEIGYGSYSYERTMRQWWNSPGHHDVMMTPAYNAAGGAWARHSDGGHYSVMVWLTLCSQAAAKPLKLEKVYDPDRQMLFKAGEHVGYQLGSGGEVLASKRYTLGGTSGADALGRSVVDGKAYLKISNGIWAGYWMRESSKTYVRGTSWSRNYRPDRRLGFEAGTFTGYRYDKAGRVVGKKSYRLTRSSGANADRVAVINGRRHFLVANGVWAGYWVRDTAKVHLK